MLKPDLVVMTTDGNPKEFEERLRSLNIRTFVFTARRLGELSQGIRNWVCSWGRGKGDALAREIGSQSLHQGQGPGARGRGKSRSANG